MKPHDYIQNCIRQALVKLNIELDDEKMLSLEKPKQSDFGDIATPIAMNLARVVRQAPRKIAESLIENFDIDTYYIEKVEIAGPGFLNFYLSKSCLQDSILDILQQGENYGKGQQDNPQKIQFEFVSANPTGPLNIVSARAAAVGDVLSSLCTQAGHSVHREFYVNDAGRQVRLLGKSLSARYLTVCGMPQDVPEDGYHGEYLIDLAKSIFDKDGNKYCDLDAESREQALSRIALDYMTGRQKESMKKYRLEYDNWFSESTLREENAHERVLLKLEQGGYTYSQDGALWFKSSDFGDEKDRVLITSEGEPTYFLIDIAYHETKYERGFEKLYDLWGPDHHGYIPRMKAALQALGHPEDSFQVHIIQQVNLLRDGQPVKMSKRAGKIIEMDELIEEVGVDAARYFFVDRRMSQPLDFDIELAKKQSDENPVYYVQYAHARISNVIRFAQESGVDIPEKADVTLLENEREFELIKKLLDLPELISKAAFFLEPHRVTNYLHETATIFHRFYHDNRVVTEDKELTHARLLLCKATKQVLANGLKILGVSAPENM